MVVDQAHQQRHQHGDAGPRYRPSGEGPQGGGSVKDNGQGDEQTSGQSLLGVFRRCARLPPSRSSVKKGFAVIDATGNHQPVGKNSVRRR
ncbi:hypothetical protein KCP69_21065 [Salmonella enterica subsp. enterica]|nr:hypothetical protein KCP69_21065 [Salmonella enterica subsp. enterica]